MKCPEFESEKLEGRDSEGFRAHRAACEGCRSDLEDYEEVRALYREASDREKIGGVKKTVHRWTPPAWLPLATAAVVLLGLLVTIVRRDEHGGEETAATEPAASASSSFVRVPLAVWTSDRSIDRQFSEAWRMLESLERRN